MVGALLLGFICGVIARVLMPGDVFRNMSGPTSWAVSLGLGLAGALVGYVIFTLGLGIGDTDIFDWGGLLSALIGTLIVLGLAGYFLRRRQPGQRLPPGRPETTGRDRCREPEPVRIQLLLDRTQPDLGKRRRPADCPAWQVYSPEGPSRACGARCWHLPPDPCGMVAVCSAASVAPAGEDARWNVGVGTR
jgi:uncharacterized membrane protein YeaQ/YmgE (transglycosylase-associated protein family)